MNRGAARKIWHLPVAWFACDDEQVAIEPPAPAVIFVYVPYWTPLPPGAQQAVTAAKAPLAVTAGATGRSK